MALGAVANLIFDWGFIDYQVSLNVADINAPTYRVLSNTEETLIVESAVDLSTVVGNELIGVQTFETLSATNGANVDFGGDRVIINNIPASIIDASSTVNNASPDSVLP